MRVAAIDLGGTRCKGGVVEVTDTGPPTVASRLEPREVAGLGAEQALEVAAGMVGDLAPVDVVGLSLPGLHDDGVVVSLPGKFPGMEGLNVETKLRNATGLEVLVANDAIAAGVGEAVAGAGRGADAVVMVTVGTGIGVSVVRDGQPVGRGRVGGGILGGQVPISAPEGPTDTAGRQGTIEARCRADRILAEAQAAGCTATTVPEVLDLAVDGDVPALTGLVQWRRWFLRALTALAHAHAPDVVVVGGGPVRDGHPLLDGMADDLRGAAWPGYRPDLRPAALADDAALVGIAHLAAARPTASPAPAPTAPRPGDGTA